MMHKRILALVLLLATNTCMRASETFILYTLDSSAAVKLLFNSLGVSKTYRGVKSNARYNNIDVVNRVRAGSMSATSDMSIGGNLTISGTITGGSGITVAGPAISTENAIARWNGANGDLLKNSTPLLLDDGRISTVTDPVNEQDAATKLYADEVARFHGKEAVRLVAVTDQFGGVQPTTAGMTIDGVVVDAGDRILLIDEGGGTNVFNGIWIAQIMTWTRPSDFADGSAAASDFTTAQEGTTYHDTSWKCTNTPPNDIVGTNALSWVQFAATSIVTLLPVDTNGSPNGDGAFLTAIFEFNLNSADATNPGIVNYNTLVPSTTQTFGGPKTFAALLTASSGLTVTGSTGITGATTVTGATEINTSGGATTTIGATVGGGAVEINSLGTITVESADTVNDSIKIEASATNANTTLHLTSQGTGTQAIHVESAGGIDMDAANTVAINSNGNVINIGSENVNQNINLGTNGLRTVAIGSTTSISSIVLSRNSSISHTWPIADGATGTGIITNGSGALSFSAEVVGDVTGPGSATPQAAAIFSGSGGLTIKNSLVTIADTTGNMTGVGGFSSNGTASINGSSAQTTNIGTGGGVTTIGLPGAGTTTIHARNTNTTSGTTNVGNTTGATLINGSSAAINSPSGALSIGTNNNAQSLLVGTTGGHQITVGTNGNASNRLRLNSGSTNGIEINDDVNSPTKINSGSSTSTVDIGNQSNSGTVTIESATSVNLVAATNGVLINNSVSGPTKINNNASGTSSSTVNIGHISSGGAVNIKSSNLVALNCSGASGVRINETGTGPTRINAGSEDGLIELGNTSTSSCDIQASGDINIGTGSQPGNIFIGTNSGGSRTITIGGPNQGNSLHLNAGGGGGATFQFIGVIQATSTHNLQLSSDVVVKSASSRRYKQNITSTVNSECIYDLEAVEYEYKSNLCMKKKGSTAPKRLYGWIAEDVDLVSTNLVNYDAEGEPDSVRYGDAVVLVVEELKKLKANQAKIKSERNVLFVDLKAKQEEKLKAMVKKMNRNQKVLTVQAKSLLLYIAILEEQIEELENSLE